MERRQLSWQRGELLGLKVGDSESEPFWSDFIGSLKERGLTGVKLVISDAHKGLTNAIRRMLHGSCWQRCRAHFARNLLQRVPKAHQGMVTAALRSVFAQEKASEIEARWDDLASSLAERFPNAAKLMLEAREDVLAFRHFPEPHWRKVWSTNLLERVNEEIKRRTRVVGIFPNDAAITRLVGAVLLEQDEHWQLEGRRMFSGESMAAIPSLEELPTQPSLQEATASANSQHQAPGEQCRSAPHRAQWRCSPPGGRRQLEQQRFRRSQQPSTKPGE